MNKRNSFVVFLIEALLLLAICNVFKGYFTDIVIIMLLVLSVILVEFLNRIIFKAVLEYEDRCFDILATMQAYAILFWMMAGCGNYSIGQGVNFYIAVIATLLFIMAEIVLLWWQHKRKEEHPSKVRSRSILYMHILNGVFIIQFIATCFWDA